MSGVLFCVRRAGMGIPGIVFGKSGKSRYRIEKVELWMVGSKGSIQGV